jgi:N-acetylglucosaminyldiphosphoundecaprenol N-acetyl-beta-D-mannosaminyltransferase
MIEKIKLAGISFAAGGMDDYLQEVHTYLNNDELNSIEFISANSMAKASDHPAMQECFERLDLLIPADELLVSELTEATGRPVELVRTEDLLHKMIQLIAEESKSIYLLMQNDKYLKEMQELLHEAYDDQVSVVGVDSMDREAGDLSDTVNEINVMEPDVVFAVLECPIREEFFLKYGRMINAKLWLTVSFENIPVGDKKSESPFRRFLTSRRIRRQIQNSEEAETAELPEVSPDQDKEE